MIQGNNSEPDNAGRIILVEDDDDLLAAQTQGLQIAGFKVLPCSSAEEALRQISKEFEGVILSDVRMPRIDGLVFMEQVKTIDPEIPILLLTGHGDVEMAVHALKNGAYDFLIKPFPMDKLVMSLRQASEKRRLVIENRHLRALHEVSADGGSLLLGDSAVMLRLRETLAQVADAEVDLLISGDTGTGKESAARTLHRLSNRRNKPFLHLNCASLPDETFYIDLFGSEPARSSYAATSRRIAGRLERAHKGFVLLDEVDALSLPQQAKLLNVIETREIWPVGAEEPRPFDARIVATSKQDLRGAVESGQFRADLFYRLSGVTIHIPPLVQRLGDVQLLFQHFVVRSCARIGRPIPQLTARVIAHIQTYDWPGNVRELEHFAERFALGLDVIGGPGANPDGKPELGLAERLSHFESDVIRQVLETHGGNAGASATALGLGRKTLYDKLARHQIDIRLYRAKGKHTPSSDQPSQGPMRPTV